MGRLVSLAEVKGEVGAGMTIMPGPKVRPTWEELVEMEPRLEALRLRAARIRATDRDTYKREWAWYGPEGLKRELMQLVGWFRRDPGPDALWSGAAYEVAYSTICEALGL